MVESEQVKGYIKLTEKQQALFRAVYKRHNAGLGMDAKEEYTPISVKYDSKQDCLIVKFLNGDWLHYTQHGDWY
jgi:hypothetical protein